MTIKTEIKKNQEQRKEGDRQEPLPYLRVRMMKEYKKLWY